MQGARIQILRACLIADFMMPKPRSTKILIVGSGVAGAVIANELLSKGLGPITMLEAGPTIVMRDKRKWLDLVMAGKPAYASSEDRSEDYVATGQSPWFINGGRLIARGGSTLHWGGWCPRFRPEDFALRSAVGRGLIGHSVTRTWNLITVRRRLFCK